MMATNNGGWFCCSGESVEYDKWQDLDPKARNAAQREISMMTGNVPYKAPKPVSHTEGFSAQLIKKTSLEDKSRKSETQKTKTTKNILNPAE